MNRLIASFALGLVLLASTTADAQQRPGTRGATGQSRNNSASVSNRPSRNEADRAVQPASHVHDIHPGEIIYEGDYHGGDGGCDSCGDSAGGCSSCSVGGNYCGGCSSPRGFCICFPAHGWVQAEYLLWQPSGMRIPALVSTSPTGTARGSAGVLNPNSTASVLYGNDEVLDDSRSGLRLRFGTWFSQFPGWGIEGEYVTLGEATETFSQMSDGSTILARPFFNALDGANDSELIAFPGVVSGRITVDSRSQFDGAAVRLRKQLCCSTGCGFSQLCCQTVPTSSRLDGTIGYRYWELDETLRIQENLTLQANNPGDTFDIVDTFATRNQFNGAELGFLWQGRRGWWSLDALMRLGIGNMHQTVTNSGSTSIGEGGTSTIDPDSGFLVQRTNAGTFDRDKFTMVPELGLTVGYQMTKRLRATMGYSVVYIGNVVRPGDQVDLDVNPNLLPPELAPFTGPLRPQFTFVETDYLVQGLSFGGEFRW